MIKWLKGASLPKLGMPCWQIFKRQQMLVIDGKYRSNDGLSTTTMINMQIEDKSRKIE
jgi:hypothetical protein